MSLKKKKRKFKTPMEMSQELKAMGEAYTRYSRIIVYLSIIAVSIVMGVLFKLPLWMIVVCGVFYVAMTPKLLYNYKKQRYEKRKFDDACSYMQQMNQSFTSTHNILASLRETESTFTQGKMKETLNKAINTIENSVMNIRETEEEALSEIAKEYNCDKIRNLHDYLIRAEARGGDCTAEFKIIDQVNGIWKKVVTEYYHKMLGLRNLVAIYYGLLLAVCIYLLRFFPDIIPLISNKIVQFANMFEIILFIVVFTAADSKLNSSLLRDTKYMSEESARSANEYVRNFDGKKERKQYMPLIIITFTFCLLLIIFKTTALTIILSIGFCVLVLNLHKLIYYLNWLTLKTEMTKAFPKWLFDIFLLMQTESVEASIFYSKEYAPPVLQMELDRVCDMLLETPGNPDAYMSFLAEFHIEGVETAMRNLFSMAVGTGNREVMTAAIEQSMTILANAEKKSIKNKGDITTAYQYVPLALMSVGMIAYVVALILEVFGQLGGMIEL